MKNAPRWLVLLAAVLLSISCDLIGPVPQVRFGNSTSDLKISHGINLGQASFVGTLGPGEVTTYFKTNPGDWPVMLRDGSGHWVQDSTGKLTVHNWLKYIVEMTGNASAHSYVLNLD